MGPEYPSIVAGFIDIGVKAMQKKPPLSQSPNQDEAIPFDDALRKILSSPPVHKTAAKKPPAKKGKK